jgi:type IV pilus assembly protein PilE
MKSCPRIIRVAPGRSRAAGVTLIELMIVLLIVAILAGIAFPAYQSHIVRTNRAAARACLMEHSQLLERYYTTNLTYVGVTLPLGCDQDANMQTRYTFAAPTLTQRTYVLAATPIGVQLAKDTQCGTLTIDQASVRDATGTAGLAGCW